jgi:hypothetical protein
VLLGDRHLMQIQLDAWMKATKALGYRSAAAFVVVVYFVPDAAKACTGPTVECNA